jgi:hypothetical protein
MQNRRPGMNVYDLRKANEPEGKWVSLDVDNGLSTLMPFHDEAVFFAAHPRIKVVRHEDYPTSARLPDITRLAAFHLPAFSERARAIFEPHLKGLGQWVSLDFDEAPYWLFWLTEVRDVLDPEHSKISYFPDGEKVMHIERVVFRPEVAQAPFMWHVLQQPSQYVCVTDSALELVRQHKLTGFSFELLWNSKHGALRYGLKNWERPRLTGLEDEPFDVDAFWAEYGNRKPHASEV